jgi:hypothetical protein
VGERGLLACLLAKLLRVVDFPSLFIREAGNSAFFVDKPELPFLTSPLYVDGKKSHERSPNTPTNEQKTFYNHTDWWDRP